jgi:hypothetical protein
MTKHICARTGLSFPVRSTSVAWLPLVVALVALLGVIITNVITARNNRRIEARAAADRAALETKWRTELQALELRTDRSLETDDRKDRRAKAIELTRLPPNARYRTTPGSRRREWMHARRCSWAVSSIGI